ncbi:MAG: sodium/calcium exchanger protein [Halanaeroarchaeum sp.]
MNRQILTALAGTTALTIPWLLSHFVGIVHGYATVTTVAVSGIAVLGASFLLTWGAETAEKDVPRAFAIAVLAILAVAPEYAVDALYAWNAGQFAGSPRGIEAANLAVANMTGANRILIGIGWAGIAGFTILRSGSVRDPSVVEREGFLATAVSLDRDIGLEVVFLMLATVWAFFVPLNGGIGPIDTIALVSIYVVYIVVVLRAEHETSEEHVGVPAYLQSFAKPWRIATVLSLFAYSGIIIFTAVEPFAHGLEQLGTQIGIPSFFMIQWIAPFASESPELIVVLVLVNKARSTAGFNALISSKLNQWTLLIGTLAVIYSIALGQVGTLPFDEKQALEIWITAAQSFFALSLIVNFRMSLREAVVLFVLFIFQVFLEFLLVRDLISVAFTSHDVLLSFAVLYMVLGTVLFGLRWRSLRAILDDTYKTVVAAVTRGGEGGTR